MSEMFNVEEKSITGFFGDPNWFYQIPDYQRPYSWGDEQILKLWDDIFEAYTHNSKSYFLGTVVTTKPKTGDAKRYDVIDGQQRITTLTIFFNVLKSFVADDSTEFLAISDLICSLVNKQSRLKFLTSYQQQSNFEEFIKKTDFKIYTQEMGKKEIRGIKKDKFHNVAFELSQKVNEAVNKDNLDIVEFISFVLNKVFLIRINCADENSAIKIFNTLNDRGLDLRQSDIIKSTLLLKLRNEHEYDKESVSKAFIKDWDDMNKIISQEYNDFDSFLTVYLLTKIGKNPDNSVSTELEAVFKNVSTKDAIADIKAFVNDFEQSIANRQKDVSKDTYIKSLEYIPWSNYWVAVIMSAVRTKFKDITELEKAVHRFYYLNWIAGNTASKVKQTTFNCIDLINENADISTIKEELFNKLIKIDDVLKRVKDNLITDDNIYDKPWTRALLTVLEYERREVSEFIEFSQKVQVEHILPQTLGIATGYSFTDGEYQSSINKIGNLTLLSYRNQKASNKDFETKLNVYSGKGINGKESNGENKFVITRDIEGTYCKNLKVWNNELLEKRNTDIIAKICKFFDIESCLEQN